MGKAGCYDLPPLRRPAFHASLIPIKAGFCGNLQFMRMLRRALAILLATALALGWTGAAIAAGCGSATVGATPALSAVKSACGSCEDGGGNGQPQPGCAALACASGCVAGPAATCGTAWCASRVDADERTPSAPHAALRVRVIPPDHPPPR